MQPDFYIAYRDSPTHFSFRRRIQYAYREHSSQYGCEIVIRAKRSYSEEYLVLSQLNAINDNSTKFNLKTSL